MRPFLCLSRDTKTKSIITNHRDQIQANLYILPANNCMMSLICYLIKLLTKFLSIFLEEKIAGTTTIAQNIIDGVALTQYTETISHILLRSTMTFQVMHQHRLAIWVFSSTVQRITRANKQFYEKIKINEEIKIYATKE